MLRRRRRQDRTRGARAAAGRARGRRRRADGPASGRRGAHRRRGALACGWPFARWIRRLRPDPLRQAPAPGDAAAGGPNVAAAADRRPARPGRDRRARARGSSRSGSLPPPWPRLVRDAALAEDERLPDRLDRAVASAELHASRPRWWRVAGAAPAAPRGSRRRRRRSGSSRSRSSATCGSRTSCRSRRSPGSRFRPGSCSAASWPGSRSDSSHGS